MAAASVLFRVFLGPSLLLILCSDVSAQSLADSTENEAWPEADAHVQLPSNWRLLSFAGLEQAAGYPFQQWYVATAIGRQLKPISKPHLLNIDPDKEHNWLLGVGYEYLRTTQSGNVKNENRITFDMTPHFRPTSRLLLSDRNWLELRWINGKYSTTYRNQPSLERDFLLHGFRFTPYGTFEIFYDGDKHSWDQEWYTAGIEWPFKRTFMLETYYRREHCSTCVPQNWNAGGATLHFYFRNTK